MSTLLLRLSAPLQAWGAESRFTERRTGHEPTKSGIVGLLAAALGRRRTDHIEDLAKLSMGIREDQSGSYVRDFQTSHTRKFDQRTQEWVFDKSLPLSNRYYLSDALFIVAVEGERNLLCDCAEALEHPVFPLYLGRRSCPPAEKIFIGCYDYTDLLYALEHHPWEASDSYFRRMRYDGFGDLAADKRVKLNVLRDILPKDEGGVSMMPTMKDVPLSFSQEHRLYGRRIVVRDAVYAPNTHYSDLPATHDPFSAIEEVS